MASKQKDPEPATEQAGMVRDGIDIAHLVRSFPPEAISSRKGGGGKSFDYLDFSAVVNRLNDATGYRWSFRILREEWVQDVLMVTGELEIPGLGCRAAVGVQKYATGSGEDLLKGGASDCLKKCASLFGVGLFTCDDRLSYAEPYNPNEPHEHSQAAQSVATGKPLAPNGNPALLDKPISLERVEALGYRAHAIGLDPEALSVSLHKWYGKDQLGELTNAEANDLLAKMEARERVMQKAA